MPLLQEDELKNKRISFLKVPSSGTETLFVLKQIPIDTH